ncbi:MAG: SGNH/GDSL hydrolase family protein [Candidatus Diapherotrites archaeon]
MRSSEYPTLVMVVLFSFIIGLFLAEGLLIVLNIEPAPNLLCTYISDETRGHALYPNLSGHFVYEPEIDMNFTINKLGMRGSEPDEKLKKIFLAGDSVSFGYSVDQNESFAAKTNQEIKKFGYELLNLGTPGYGLTQSLITIKKNLVFNNPEIVVLEITTPNDWSDDYTFTTVGPTNWVDEQHCMVSKRPAGVITTIKSIAYRNSRLARLINKNFRQENLIESNNVISDSLLKDPTQIVVQARQIQRQRLNEFRELQSQYHFKSLILLIPSRIETDEVFFNQTIQNTRPANEYNRREQIEFYLGICKEMGFECIDMGKAFEEEYQSESASTEYYNHKIDHHPNKKGNLFIAETLIPEIVQKIQEDTN